VLKPSPEKVQAFYLQSLEAVGFKLKEHDIRFVHDDWESPTLGAWGLGWEVWCDGMEVSQFTYFQGMASIPLKPICAEITYGLERLCMFIQNVNTIFDIHWNKTLTLGDIAKQSEIEWSAYNFTEASTEMWQRHFEDYEKEAKRLATRCLPIPAYDFILKASHAFNILDARGVISVTERTGYIARIRDLSRLVAMAYLTSREKLGFPLAKETEFLPKVVKLPSKKFNPEKRHDFLLEIGSEELPATFIPTGQRNLERDINKLLESHGIPFDRIVSYGSPRRIAVKVEGMVEGIKSQTIEKKGPPVSVALDSSGKWTAQGEGFLKSIGKHLAPLTSLKGVRKEAIKGIDYLFATVEVPGKSTAQILAQELPNLIANLEFPKKMRWGSFDVSYARPIHWIVALFGKEVIPFVYADIISSNFTFGHAQRSPKKIVLKTPDEYLEKLKNHFVFVDVEERKQSILKQIENIPVLDVDRVLPQVVYLTEWPEVIVGTFDKDFLHLPKEVLISEMIEHQKYFPIGTEKNLKNEFVITCDNTPTALICEGNQKVLSARLNDGSFLYNQDLKTPLTDFNKKLSYVVFQQDLGSMLDKVWRIEKIAAIINTELEIGDSQKVERAALLCKADLASSLVKEFPELQGTIGKYYALKQKEDSEVATAIEEHWMPRVEGAPLPTSPTGVIVCLADKIDNLLAYYSVNLKPTSSSDPYGLRRQTIGILKILIEGQYSLDLHQLLLKCSSTFLKYDTSLIEEILKFITARAKGVFEEFGFAKDEIDASLRSLCIDPYDQFCQIKALHAFRKTDAFAPLFEVYKRAKGQLDKPVSTLFNPVLATAPAEKHLLRSLETVDKQWAQLLAEKDYEAAYKLLALLQPPLATLFDTVKILADDPEMRDNRLALLQKVFSYFSTLLDFSRIG
jgi:glycyl-tRNA synthetase